MPLPLKLLFSIILLTNITYGQVQETGRMYVRIVVPDVHTWSQALEIDQFIRSKPGVLTSRMDRRTHLYLGVFDVDSGVQTTDFKEWISDLGYETSCSVSGEHGNGERIKQLSLEGCNQGIQLQNHE